MKYLFDEPIPTKSGRKAVELWKELKREKHSYAILSLTNDKINAIITAKKIRKLQDDLKITPDGFLELGCFIDHNR